MLIRGTTHRIFSILRVPVASANKMPLHPDVFSKLLISTMRTIQLGEASSGRIGAAMPDVTYVTSSALLQDGLEYTISVYQSSVGFFAFWECQTCGKQSNATAPVPDRDAAINSCRMLIDQHHARYHSVVVQR
ncbi:MAG TPA: hypothetical protein VGJ04_10405 [Pirellulales bacterium]|jgi:hypothetical protein